MTGVRSHRGRARRICFTSWWQRRSVGRGSSRRGRSLGRSP